MEGSIRAAGYIRVSTEEQTEYSPDAQRKALEAYAAQHGMVLLSNHLYLDAGISGRKASARPAFLAMIAAAKQSPPPFTVILVHKFDRFARSREDSIVYKSMLRRQCGIQVISVTEQLADDRMGLILEAMLEAMAEYYSINLADEVRKGMTEKARRGELQTAPPFGYRAEANRLVPVPREAEAVQALFHRFLAGESIAALARWTREQGILSHRGNPLDSRGIRYILENPVYIGKLRWGTGEKKGLTVTDGSHTPLVEQGVYLAVQARLRSNAARHGLHAQPDGARKHWLAGLVRCAVCGGGLILSRSRYLRCGRYGKGKCPASQHVPADALEAAVLAQLRRDAAGPGRIVVTPGAAAEPDRQEALSRRAAAVERKLIRLREAYLCGAETAEEYRVEKEKLFRQAEEARRAIQEESARQERSQPAERLQKAAELLTAPDVSVEDTYRAAVAVLASCVWDKSANCVTLTYRWKTNS